jgi:hypothetical protein
MSDQPPVAPPDYWVYEREVIHGCEVMDFVLNPDGTVLQERMQNLAANIELQRRYPDTQADRWGGLSRSGETEPYAISWVNTCGGSVVEPGTANVLMGYGVAIYGQMRYGGTEGSHVL